MIVRDYNYKVMFEGFDKIYDFSYGKPSMFNFSKKVFPKIDGDLIIFICEDGNMMMSKLNFKKVKNEKQEESLSWEPIKVVNNNYSETPA